MATGETKTKRVRKKKVPAEVAPPRIRLNLGGAISPLEGYENWDKATGQEAFPLHAPDNTVDEIRASHLLEHFSHTQTQAVLQDWVRALKPGGVLKVAVPDLDAIIAEYHADPSQPIEGWLMGDHCTEGMAHGAIFTRDKLRMLLKAAGLVRIRGWYSSHDDCADLSISLNLQGIKPDPDTLPDRPASMLPVDIAACMSMPRLAFTDNYFCAYQALIPDKVPLRKHTGAFWGQCLTRSIEETLAEFPNLNAVLTLDYDTIFSRDDVIDLCRLMAEHPEADAIATLQASRTKQTCLMTMEDENGKRLDRVKGEAFAPDLTKIATAHFGLTLIRADNLRSLPKPWFIATADPTGRWEDGRIDDDIHFWRIWEKAGNTLFLANRIPVGHAELMIRWPRKDMKPMYQHPSEFWKDGKPAGVWV